MIAAIVLAAGASRRFGTPKQLARLDGRTLLERAVQHAATTGPVFVVTGAHAESIRASVAGLATCVHNASWSEGMGSSLAVGLGAALAALPQLSGVLVCTCDQPWIEPAHLRALVCGLDMQPVVASQYSGVIGVPAAFAASVFAELLALRGDRGARDVIRRDPTRVLTMACADAARDVDYRRDLP